MLFIRNVFWVMFLAIAVCIACSAGYLAGLTVALFVYKSGYLATISTSVVLIPTAIFMFCFSYLVVKYTLTPLKRAANFFAHYDETKTPD